VKSQRSVSRVEGAGEKKRRVRGGGGTVAGGQARGSVERKKKICQN